MTNPANEPEQSSACRRPFPTRLAAFVLAGLIIMALVYNRLRNGSSSGIGEPPIGENNPMAEDKRFPEPPRPAPIDGPGASSAKRSYTNESLQSFLLSQREKLGIRKILPPGARELSHEAYEAPGYQPPPPEGRTLDQARGMMRQMAEELERAVQSRRPPSVALREGTKPALLAKPESAQIASGSPIGSDK